MAGSKDDNSAKKKSKSNDPTHLDFGDLTDLGSIGENTKASAPAVDLNSPPPRAPKTADSSAPRNASAVADRVPQQVVRDERVVGRDIPDSDYEIPAPPPAEIQTEESFWREAEKVFPGCIGNKIHVRLDPDIWQWFKSTGSDWEDRINLLLREHMERNSGK